MDWAQLNSAVIFPHLMQELELLKNYDSDPITPEEEVDLLASHEDYLAGNYVSFSPDTPRETIMNFLDDL
jgi:hypothetical protein